MIFLDSIEHIRNQNLNLSFYSNNQYLLGGIMNKDNLNKAIRPQFIAPIITRTSDNLSIAATPFFQNKFHNASFSSLSKNNHRVTVFQVCRQKTAHKTNSGKGIFPC
jgi:hypothetical protein